jgi:YgiT-type zinc finger domain-containing protein
LAIRLAILQGKEVNEMKCVFCGGTVVKREVTFTYEEDDKYLIVEHVPAEVCTRCGEKTYSPEVTDGLLRFARKEVKPARKIEVPVYDYAANQRATTGDTLSTGSCCSQSTCQLINDSTATKHQSPNTMIYPSSQVFNLLGWAYLPSRGRRGKMSIRGQLGVCEKEDK